MIQQSFQTTYQRSSVSQGPARSAVRRGSSNAKRQARPARKAGGKAPSPPAQERLRLVAQRLFSKYGFNGVSLRTITDEAQVNIAAVNYYYGSKHNLYAEVVKYHMTAVLEARLERLQALEDEFRRRGKPPSLRVVFESWLIPSLDLYYRPEGDGPAILGLALQLDSVVGPEGLAKVLQPYADYLRRLYALLGACLPRMSPDMIIWRFECATAMVFNLLGQPDWQIRVPHDYCNIADRKLMHQRLLESALTLFRADS
jgi:AcrR family transcriptional regulator